MSWPFKREMKTEMPVDVISVSCRVDALAKRLDNQDHEIAKLQDRLSNLNMALAFKAGKKPPESRP